MGNNSGQRMSWRCAALIAAVWLTAAGMLLAVVRVLCFSRDLSDQQFLLWGLLVFAALPLVCVMAGASHRSWKVALIVFLAGALIALFGVNYFQ